MCFILPMPSKIALTWFPNSEVSLAASVGTAGFLSGWGVGYLLPVFTLKGPIETFQDLNQTSFPHNWRDQSVWGKELTRQATQEVSLEVRRLYIALAAWTCLLFLLVCLLVDSAPEYYPSQVPFRRNLRVQICTSNLHSMYQFFYMLLDNLFKALHLNSNRSCSNTEKMRHMHQ